MSVTCQSHVSHMSVTCQSHVSLTSVSRQSHMSVTCQSHVSHMSVTCQSHVSHMSVTYQSHMSVTCQSHAACHMWYISLSSSLTTMLVRVFLSMKDPDTSTPGTKRRPITSSASCTLSSTMDTLKQVSFCPPSKFSSTAIS